MIEEYEKRILSSTAAALYDQGWRADRYEDLVQIYAFEEEQARFICARFDFFASL